MEKLVNKKIKCIENRTKKKKNQQKNGFQFFSGFIAAATEN